MPGKKEEFITTVAILSRRLRKGKTYEDFRRAWFHSTGFGVQGKGAARRNRGAGNRMYSLINPFDPREIIVLGFARTTLRQLKDALEIDVKVRGENPLDSVIEGKIGRKFGMLVSEDDFSKAGQIPYKGASIGGKSTDMGKFGRDLGKVRGIFAAAARKRDRLNEKRGKKG